MGSICHLTSVHPRYDIRIFVKQCQSLAKAGYRVSLIVADGKGSKITENINIFDVGNSTGRIDRMFRVTGRVFKKAKALNADIYHLHDPELIPVGLKIKHLGKKAIFDSHEDIPRQISAKLYLNRPARLVIASVFSLYEKWACKRFDLIVAATPFICRKFLQMNLCSIEINNYPLLSEFSPGAGTWSAKKKQVCYLGGIHSIRGIKEIVKAMECVKSNVRLELGGRFVEPLVEQEVKNYKGWSRIDELGWLDRDRVRGVLARSVAGLVIFNPWPNHIDSQPNKMFEYMSAGIPVIASDFPLWRQIIEGNNCGICVDPMNSKEIAAAINRLVTNPDLAAKMGRNGRKAVEEKYNWRNEEQKLLGLYRDLL